MEDIAIYLMEHTEEIARLEMKTDTAVVRQQGLWAGLGAGMRLADIGCGAGVTTRVLFDLAQPCGTAVGVDISAERIAHAERVYGAPGLSFTRRDVRDPLDDLGGFDFIWVRFFLEYHRSGAFGIVRNLARALKPGGILCLIDLDHNCLNHFHMPDRLSGALRSIIGRLEARADFDPHAGIKLYSYLYDLGFERIDVALSAHHLIYGPLGEVDAFNWRKKLEIAARRSGHSFAEYPDGFEGFVEEFERFFADPRRFTYTPMIACRGSKPMPDLSAE